MSIWYYSLHLQKHVRGNILEQRGEHLASLALLATLMTGSIDLQLLPPAVASKLHDVSHSNTSSEVSILASFRAVAGQNLCLLTAANSVKQFLAETAWKRFPRKNHPTHFFLIYSRPKRNLQLYFSKTYEDQHLNSMGPGDTKQNDFISSLFGHLGQFWP